MLLVPLIRAAGECAACAVTACEGVSSRHHWDEGSPLRGSGCAEERSDMYCRLSAGGGTLQTYM